MSYARVQAVQNPERDPANVYVSRVSPEASKYQGAWAQPGVAMAAPSPERGGYGADAPIQRRARGPGVGSGVPTPALSGLSGKLIGGSSLPVAQLEGAAGAESSGLESASVGAASGAEVSLPGSLSTGPGQDGARRVNRTGLPDTILAGTEMLSGLDLSDVRVYRNSRKPTALNAHAYTQGTNIYVAPGQERHLAHEAWHVVQQYEGRVSPQVSEKGVAMNTDSRLESEADRAASRMVSTGPKENLGAEAATVRSRGRNGSTRQSFLAPYAREGMGSESQSIDRTVATGDGGSVPRSPRPVAGVVQRTERSYRFGKDFTTHHTCKGGLSVQAAVIEHKNREQGLNGEKESHRRTAWLQSKRPNSVCHKAKLGAVKQGTADAPPPGYDFRVTFNEIEGVTVRRTGENGAGQRQYCRGEGAVVDGYFEDRKVDASGNEIGKQVCSITHLARFEKEDSWHLVVNDGVGQKVNHKPPPRADVVMTEWAQDEIATSDSHVKQEVGKGNRDLFTIEVKDDGLDKSVHVTLTSGGAALTGESIVGLLERKILRGKRLRGVSTSRPNDNLIVISFIGDGKDRIGNVVNGLELMSHTLQAEDFSGMKRMTEKKECEKQRARGRRRKKGVRAGRIVKELGEE